MVRGGARSAGGRKQLKLQECKGVCRSRQPFLHTTIADVVDMRRWLDEESKHGQPEGILEVLRHLSVRLRHYSSADLVDALKRTGVGRSCTALGKHRNAEVATFAKRLVASWRLAVAPAMPPPGRMVADSARNSGSQTGGPVPVTKPHITDAVFLVASSGSSASSSSSSSASETLSPHANP
eukprot:CAMPEP_0172686104 /NCGR_PEP_ID=MMETSP1074-20121228/20694_1 /TAXON_ID=2916 /ORGANISM="Ceratium fusus, Strain PA161109" /LENGTH=180 /DNA_ID=CAMNT_0013505357 /DNA_START=72 /DNA_END=614 /DNA_ORIENTATION=-